MSSPPWLVSITLCGDHADLIGDALRSVVDWVDGCVVVDTGSGDDSLDVARAVGGPKYIERRFPWVNDFSSARNFGLDVARELGAEWAVLLDTDERIDPSGVDLRALLDQSEAAVLTVVHDSGTYEKERFFRLPARGRFIGATHEYYSDDAASRRRLDGLRFSEIPKSPEQYRQKFERDVEILGGYVERYPRDPRWFYYLGDALHNLQCYEQAIAAYRACAALKGWDEESAWACYRAAECWIALGDWDNAVESCALGLARHAGIAELAWLAAFASWRAERFVQAVAWARLSVAMGKFRGHGESIRRIGFRNPHALYEGPYDVLRFALRALGDDAGAREAERLYRHAAAVHRAEGG